MSNDTMTMCEGMLPYSASFAFAGLGLFSVGMTLLVIMCCIKCKQDRPARTEAFSGALSLQSTYENDEITYDPAKVLEPLVDSAKPATDDSRHPRCMGYCGFFAGLVLVTVSIGCEVPVVCRMLKKG